MSTLMPAKPAATESQVPEFVTNQPDPSTGIPKVDTDSDIHDNVYSQNNLVNNRHYGGATFEGDMGRLSKI